jgi:hypothetical protein
MRRLGYERYVSQCGDWGAIVSEAMAHRPPPGLLGIHVNMPAVVPEDIAKVLSNGDPAPSGLSSEEKDAFASLDAFYRKGAGYAAIMNTRPTGSRTPGRLPRGPIGRYGGAAPSTPWTSRSLSP